MLRISTAQPPSTNPACPLRVVTAACLLLVALWTASGTLQNNTFARERPNVIFFLSDDHRADLLGCAGHPVLKTPVIDRLAQNGVRFQNMFVTTSICAASRATLFTGMFERTHKFTFRTPPLASELTDVSYPRLLKDAGYRTGFVGKFGVNIPRAEREKMFDFFSPTNRNPYFKKQPNGRTRHITQLAGDRAIRFLRAQPSGQPFCLSVSFHAAHAEDSDKVNHFPWPRAVEHLYQQTELPEPRLSDPQIFARQPEFLRESMNRQRWFWRWDTRQKYQRNLRGYYRMISGLDLVMGRVLGTLSELGMSDNTVIIFSGDNGYYAGERGFAGKWSHYEESLRVPLVIFDPRLEKAQRGKVCQALALNVDIAPTITALAGLTPSEHQGQSLLPLLSAPAPKSWRQDFFCEHLFDHMAIPKWEGVHEQRWVYARYFQQQPTFEFLHDLQADPDQVHNLATDATYATQLTRLQKRCDELRNRYGGIYTPENFPTVNRR